MFSKSLAVGALAAGCVAAAAAGAYVAVRHNQVEARPVAVDVREAALPAPVSDTASSAAEATPKPVAETEAVVTPEGPPATAPSSVPEPVEAAPRAAAVQNPATKDSPKATKDSATKAAKPEQTARPPARAQTARNDVPAANAPQVKPAPEPVREPVAPPPPRELREAVAEAPPQPVEPPQPPPPQFEQLVVPASSVVGLRVETPLTTERAQVEDRVDARVTRDVMADGRVAIPAGAKAVGTVVLVERGGKIKDRARLGVRFHTLVLSDGSELPISTEAIYREGDSPSGESTRKIGGATVGGAILGAIIGGKKGALIGGATGAAGGTAVVMSGDRNAATLPSGTIVTIRLAAPVGVEVEKQ